MVVETKNQNNKKAPYNFVREGEGEEDQVNIKDLKNQVYLKAAADEALVVQWNLGKSPIVVDLFFVFFNVVPKETLTPHICIFYIGNFN